MNHILRYGIHCIFFVVVTLCEASEFATLMDLQQIVSKVDEKTLVVFDIDDVIVAPHISWIWHEGFLEDHRDMEDSQLDMSSIKSLRYPMQYQFVDKEFSTIFRAIKEKGGQTLALTARDDIDQNLWQFFEANKIFFNYPLSNPGRQKNILCKKGIICCNNQDKGECLFEAIQGISRTIIFVDDKLENCHSVLNACRCRKIPCSVYQYGRAESLFSEKISELQYRYWKEYGVPLSDEAAKSMLDRENTSIERVPSLLERLQHINPATTTNAQLDNLWQVHQEWIMSLVAFVQKNENQSVPIAYPEDTHHPIYHFDQEEARCILRNIFKNCAHYELTDELIGRIFFEQVPFYRENKKLSSYETYSTQEVKSEVFRVAKKVHELVRGNILLLLGQTPAYLGEMVKVIDVASKTDTVIVNIPFSGRPNYIKKHTYKRIWHDSYLDIVTSEGENRLRALLEKQNFSPRIAQLSRKKIFLVDNSTGASVSSFLAFLHNWFAEANIAFPDTTFLEMCDASDFTVLDENGRWVNAEKPNLCFDESLKFDLPVVFLGMNDTMLKKFDKLFDNLRIVPSFNGIHWSKKYFEKELLEYPTDEARQLIQEYQEYAIAMHEHCVR